MTNRVSWIMLLISGLALVTTFSAAADSHSKASTNAILIKNAQIYDGSGRAAYKGDLRLQNGIIVAIGPLEMREGEKVWDAHGLALAPGFIDPHATMSVLLLQILPLPACSHRA